MRTSCVVEALEDGHLLGGEMSAVHVVDGVGELACEPHALGGAEARAVLDVATLATVIPAHPGDVVSILARRR